VPIGERTTYVLSPMWLLREKIITQHSRAGSKKEKTDLQDIRSLVGYVGREKLVMKLKAEKVALKALVDKRQDWRELLERAIVSRSLWELGTRHVLGFGGEKDRYSVEVAITFLQITLFSACRLYRRMKGRRSQHVLGG
jgi:hypothetical protein